MGKSDHLRTIYPTEVKGTTYFAFSLSTYKKITSIWPKSTTPEAYTQTQFNSKCQGQNDLNNQQIAMNIQPIMLKLLLITFTNAPNHSASRYTKEGKKCNPIRNDMQHCLHDKIFTH
jgi:hypothetical protein